MYWFYISEIKDYHCHHNSIRVAFFFFNLRQVVHSDHILAEVKCKIGDGDHHITDCRVSIVFIPLHVHRELWEGVMAVGDQVVFTHARKLVHITIERLEVLPAPCATDAAHMVTDWRNIHVNKR